MFEHNFKILNVIKLWPNGMLVVSRVVSSNSSVKEKFFNIDILKYSRSFRANIYLYTYIYINIFFNTKLFDFIQTKKKVIIIITIKV